MNVGSSIDHQTAHGVLREDPALGPVVERNGIIRLEPAPDFFDRLCQSVVRQQISMSAADAIYERLERDVHLTPAGIQSTDESTLQDLGLSAAKARTLRSLSQVWRENEWDRAFFATLEDEAVIAALTDVRGIGPWTAKMALLFGLARPDVWPVEDLGIRRGMHRLHGEDIARSEMVARAENWRPYRSVAALHLWRIADS